MTTFIQRNPERNYYPKQVNFRCDETKGGSFQNFVVPKHGTYNQDLQWCLDKCNSLGVKACATAEFYQAGPWNCKAWSEECTLIESQVPGW